MASVNTVGVYWLCLRGLGVIRAQSLHLNVKADIGQASRRRFEERPESASPDSW